MRKGPEATLEAAICAYARSRGCITYKFVSPSHRSVPDRLFFGPKGQTLLLEIKAPGKKPTPLQLRELEILNRNYVAAEWVDNLADAKALFSFHFTV